MIDQCIGPRVAFLAIGLFDQGQQRLLGVGIHEAADAGVDRIADEAVLIQAGQVLVVQRAICQCSADAVSAWRGLNQTTASAGRPLCTMISTG